MPLPSTHLGLKSPLRWPALTATIGLTALLLVAGCSHIERAGPRPRGASSIRDLDGMQRDQLSRGTVGAETATMGWDDRSNASYVPTVVRGYGLVTGLAGTGSRDIPPTVRAHMLEIMARHGVGSERSGFGHITPEMLLDSQDTAVVIVEAILPPGAVGRTRTPPVASGRLPEIQPGTTFDVRVSADPRTGTTSLEGGQLYSTDLRPGPLLTGSKQARRLAVARGPIFLNPFVSEEAAQRGELNLRNGRILDGGEAVEDSPIKLQLYTPSHSRIRTIQNAINRRFPIERGQRRQTAAGVNDGLLEITIPPSYRDDPDRFVRILQHITIRQIDIESIADSIRRSLIKDPSGAATAYWRWVALGPAALPAVRELYDFPEQGPRLAALRAGADLADPQVGEELRTMTQSELVAERLEAAYLLSKLPREPRSDAALRQLLEDDDIEVRFRAYEALEKRGSTLIRRSMAGDRFALHQVPSSYSTIYVTQTQEPRIVLFGEDLQIDRPITLGLWDNEMLIKDDPEEDVIEVLSRTGPGGSMVIDRISPDLQGFILLLAHTPSVEDPLPGLDLPYSRVVGTLHGIWTAGFLPVDFKAEQDRAMAELRRAGALSTYRPRPEFSSGQLAPNP